jgi:CHASE2 domain-containing sensor protein
MKGSIIGSRFLTNRAIAAFLITVIVLISVLLLSIPNIGRYSMLTGRIVELANLGMQNLFFRQVHILDPNNAPKILIVAIDDNTLNPSHLGRWQDFRRQYYAQVIDRLRADGAFVIGLDILFSEPSPKELSDDEILHQSLLS